MEYNKKTDELDNLLNNMKLDDLEEYYVDNKSYMADENKAFCYYMRDIIDTKGIKKKDIYAYADLSESYGQQLIAMEKHTKNRDVILRLCIAGHFTLLEINRALKLYGMQPLYAKDKRDALIIVAINNRIYDILDINERLEEQGFKKLSKD